MTLKKLPIGIQTFSEIRTKDYIYIDKTKEAYELIESGTKYYFLSRPRRFGKSLFLDTLQDIFEAKKELFEELYIYDKWDWEEKYPVIKLDWNMKLQTIDDLDQKLKETLKDNQDRLDVKCPNDISLHICFERLIKETYKKYNTQVVVLIDEYDKPILDVIDNKNQAKEHREYIKGLYSILKGCEQYIKFCFLTGVTKFSKASIFSGLNMISDISLNPRYGNICGYTQNDIDTTFEPYLKEVDSNRFRNYYNGYNFLKDPVYNPFDTLQFIFNDCMYDNYWFESGTPTYLVKLIKENNYFLPKLSNVVVGKELMSSFDIENIDLEVLLYQSGYLTIDKVIEENIGMLSNYKYKLKLPNLEVKSSFNTFILEYLYKYKNNNISINIYKSLYDTNLNILKDSLISLFASIPYNNYTKNDISQYEGFYASIIYVYLQSLGLEIIGEDVTNLGRIDLTIKINDIIYILEFKVGSNDALTQIKEKNYHQKYLSDVIPQERGQQKDIYLVGINFDKEEKNISTFAWEKI